MSRKLIAGLVAVVAVAGLGVAAGSALSGTDQEPHYTPLTIDLSEQGAATNAKAGPGGSSKPEVVYLESPTPTTINTADPDPANPNPPAPKPVGPFVSL